MQSIIGRSTAASIGDLELAAYKGPHETMEEANYEPIGDYQMVTAHAHLLDRMYFYGKQRERYMQECRFIHDAMSRYTRGKTMVDAGCGTGIHMMLLRDLGYTMAGFDLREEMVAVARQRNPDAAIVQGDMRSYPLDGRVDGIISMYGAINYLETEEGLDATFAGFLEHLNPGGIAIIDTRHYPNLDERVYVWSNDEYTLAKRWIKRPQTRTSLYRVFYTIPAEGIMVMEDHEQFFQQPFFLSDRLKCVGFDEIHVFDEYRLDQNFDPATGSHLPVIVAQKNDS